MAYPGWKASPAKMCNFDQIFQRSACFDWYLGFQELKLKYRGRAAGSQNGNSDLKISSKTLVEVASLLSRDVLAFIMLAKRHQVKENRL